jgi:hypothetical protein
MVNIVGNPYAPEGVTSLAFLPTTTFFGEEGNEY